MFEEIAKVAVFELAKRAKGRIGLVIREGFCPMCPEVETCREPCAKVVVFGRVIFPAVVSHLVRWN